MFSVTTLINANTMYGLTPLLQLLHAVFITGEAEPMTSVMVMSICCNIVFLAVYFPRMKHRERDRALGRRNAVRRIAGG